METNLCNKVAYNSTIIETHTRVGVGECEKIFLYLAGGERWGMSERGDTVGGEVRIEQNLRKDLETGGGLRVTQLPERGGSLRRGEGRQSVRGGGWRPVRGGDERRPARGGDPTPPACSPTYHAGGSGPEPWGRPVLRRGWSRTASSSSGVGSGGGAVPGTA
jgi:hypothetical protein